MSEPVPAAPNAPAPAAAANPDELQAELIRRFAMIRELQVARDAEKKRLQDAHRDLEHFARALADAEARHEAQQYRISELQQPWLRQLAQRFGLARRPPKPRSAATEIPGAAFTYYLYTSPYRLYRDPSFTLRGWAFPNDGRPVTALRARVDEQEFFGTYGIPEPDVIAHHGPQPNNPQPGFKIVIETPPGRHRLSLEARIDGGDWVSFLTAPLFAHHDT